MTYMTHFHAIFCSFIEQVLHWC